MKITFNGTYKALTPFESPDLPDFVVLTGKNGSGKSQLLELLSFKNPAPSKQSQKKSIPDEARELYIDGFNIRNIKMTVFGSVRPGPVGGADQTLLMQMQNQLIEQLSKARKNKRDVYNNNPHQFNLLEKIAELYDKKIDDLSEEEIMNYRFEASDFELKDIFTANIGQIVATYFGTYWDNISRITAYYEFGEDLSYIEKDEFDKKHPNPIHEINAILRSANIDYQLKEITLKEYRSKRTYIPEFVSIHDGVSVQPNDFSTGEKVLLSLAFTILNTSKYSDNMLPNLLLLDEIDAALHPSMIKNLISVLRDYLVAERDIKIILTTHNPTTVALAPANSIFVLKKESEKVNGQRFIAATKKDAIIELLDGVTAIDIIPEHRKQVFVEARSDAFFYESVYKSIANRFPPDIHVNFIASGIDDGDCALVKATVDKLRNAGNDRVYGIIDWDDANLESDPGLFVSGINEFYTLENIAFNAFHLAMFLLAENKRSFQDFSLDKQLHWIHEKDWLSVEEVQMIVRSVENEVISELKKNQSDEISRLVESHSEIALDNGMIISFNNCLIRTKGHTLLHDLRKVYPFLNHAQDFPLLREITEKVTVHSSEFLPKSVVRCVERLFF